LIAPSSYSSPEFSHAGGWGFWPVLRPQRVKRDWAFFLNIVTHRTKPTTPFSNIQHIHENACFLMLVLVLQKGIGQFPYHKSFDKKLSVVAKNTERREYLILGPTPDSSLLGPNSHNSGIAFGLTPTLGWKNNKESKFTVNTP